MLKAAHAFHLKTDAQVSVTIKHKDYFWVYTSEPRPSPEVIHRELQRAPCRRCERRRRTEYPRPLSELVSHFVFACDAELMMV